MLTSTLNKRWRWRMEENQIKKLFSEVYANLKQKVEEPVRVDQFQWNLCKIFVQLNNKNDHILYLKNKKWSYLIISKSTANFLYFDSATLVRIFDSRKLLSRLVIRLEKIIFLLESCSNLCCKRMCVVCWKRNGEYTN